MNKNALKNLYGFAFIVLSLISVGFCFHSKADPLKTLEEFHGAEIPTEPLKIKVVKLEDKPEYKPQSPPADEVLGTFHEEEKQVKKEEPSPAPEEPQPVVPDKLKALVKTPFFIGHTAEPSYSARVLTNKEEVWLNVNAQIVASEYEKIEVLNNYVSGLSVLNPVVEAGGFATIYPFDSKGHIFYIGISSGLRKNSHGIYVKALVFSDNYKELFNTLVPKGLATLYYYYAKRAVVYEYDLASFYLGWLSPPVKLNFSDVEEFKGAFQDLKSQSENLIVGVTYNPDTGKQISYTLEASLKILSFGVNFVF